MTNCLLLHDKDFIILQGGKKTLHRQQIKYLLLHFFWTGVNVKCRGYVGSSVGMKSSNVVTVLFKACTYNISGNKLAVASSVLANATANGTNFERREGDSKHSTSSALALEGTTILFAFLPGIQERELFLSSNNKYHSHLQCF